MDERKNSGGEKGLGYNERADRLYPLIYKMNEEIKSLSLQIRALRSLIEREENQ